MDNKIKHLEMISSIIERMSKNSFILKGWSITLIGAIIALTKNNILFNHTFIFYIFVVMFWFLDSYYLQIERKYSDLYDKVRIKSDTSIDFDMKLYKTSNKKCSYIRCLIAISESAFYIALVLIITFVNGIINIKKIIGYSLAICYISTVLVLAVIGLITLLLILFKLILPRKRKEYIYAVLKYTGLSLIFDIFECICKSIAVQIIGYKRINPFFVYNSKNSCINQSLSFRGLWMVITKNYYVDRHTQINDLCNVEPAVIEKIYTEGLVVNFNTTESILTKFRKLLKENGINNEILDETKIYYHKQKFERISLITTRSIINNSFNKKKREKLKKFLNKEVGTKNYYIKFM